MDKQKRGLELCLIEPGKGRSGSIFNNKECEMKRGKKTQSRGIYYTKKKRGKVSSGLSVEKVKTSMLGNDRRGGGLGRKEGRVLCDIRRW